MTNRGKNYEEVNISKNTIIHSFTQARCINSTSMEWKFQWKSVITITIKGLIYVFLYSFFLQSIKTINRDRFNRNAVPASSKLGKTRST